MVNERVKLWVEVVRPRHWIKSGFCMAALFFGGQVTSWEKWLQLFPVLLSFCALASSGYLLNDVWNRVEDRRHPKKRHRAVASGRLKVRDVLFASLVLACVGLWSLSIGIDAEGELRILMWHGLGYLALTLSYSFFFRGLPLLDVLVLGFGFVIRVSAGAFAIGVSPTLWLLGCTYGLALLLGFGKRLGEWRMLEKRGALLGDTRLALRGYTEDLLRVLVGASCLVAGGSYFLYCLFHLERGIFLLTVAPVAVGLLTYLRLAWRSEVVERPEHLLFRNPTLLGCVVVWLGMIVCFVFE